MAGFHGDRKIQSGIVIFTCCSKSNIVCNDVFIRLSDPK